MGNRARSLLEQTMTRKNAAGTLVLGEGGSLILLLQRSIHGAEPLTWAVAGGRIEEEETPYHAAIRETYEELHVDLSQEKPQFSFSQPIPGEGTLTFTTFVYHFPHIPLWSPRINGESLAFGWFTPPAALLLPLHPGMPYAFKQIGWGM